MFNVLKVSISDAIYKKYRYKKCKILSLLSLLSLSFFLSLVYSIPLRVKYTKYVIERGTAVEHNSNVLMHLTAVSLSIISCTSFLLINKQWYMF
jgi:hypothetical protein